MKNLILLFAALLFFSCNPPTENQESPDETQSISSEAPPTKKGTPEPGALTEDQMNNSQARSGLTFSDEKRIEAYSSLLNGTWNSATEQGSTLEFKDSRMKILTRQIVKLDEQFLVNIRCENENCNAIDNPPGVCVITSNNCYFLQQIDNQRLTLLSANDNMATQWTKPVEE